MQDKFYTPPTLAKELLSYVPNKAFKCIADFCVGDGELLRACLTKWPLAKYFGADISAHTIRHLKKQAEGWSLSVCDFLSKRSRSNTKFHTFKGRFDLIVLNPPFTCKGTVKHYIELDGKSFLCSKAIAFVVECIKYLQVGGVLSAILPSSVSFSEKDALIWSYLQMNFDLKVHQHLGNGSFAGCSPYTIMVSIRKVIPKNKRILLSNAIQPNIQVIRGKLSMHLLKETAQQEGNSIIHTTNLKGGIITKSRIRVRHDAQCFCGPAVLLPRVGTPDRDKICVLQSNESGILSDCILAICTSSDNEAIELRDKLLANYSFFESLYSGTGARYTTVKKMSAFVSSISSTSQKKVSDFQKCNLDIGFDYQKM